MQGPPSAPLCPAAHLQSVTRVLPLGELADSGQFEQVPAPGAEYFPAGQVVHGAAPASGLYFPAAHGAQGPPSAPLCPAPHLQSVTRVLPLGELADSGQLEQAPAPGAEYFPAGQVVHAAAPASGLYFPAAHGAQGPPSAPLCPAWHLQSVARVLPLGELEACGQLTQAAAVDAPRAAEYLPALHAMQPSVPDRDQFARTPSSVME